MQLREAVNFLPQLPILYWLFSLPLDSVDPALSFPRGNPTRHSMLDVLRVRPNDDIARLLQGPQTLDHSAELHSVVGGVRLASNQLSAMALVSQNTRPATRPWVPNATSVRRKYNVFHSPRLYTTNTEAAMDADDLRRFLREVNVECEEKPVQHGTQFRCKGGEKIYCIYDRESRTWRHEDRA